MVLVVWTMKRRHREVKALARGHTAGQCWSLDLNLSSLASQDYGLKKRIPHPSRSSCEQIQSSSKPLYPVCLQERREAPWWGDAALPHPRAPSPQHSTMKPQGVGRGRKAGVAGVRTQQTTEADRQTANAELRSWRESIKMAPKMEIFNRKSESTHTHTQIGTDV